MARLLVVLFLLTIIIARLSTLDREDLKDGQQISFTARLTHEPVTKNATERFQLFYKGNRINVYHTSGNSFRYGDILSVNGRVGKRLINGKNEFISIFNPEIEAKKDQLAILYGLRQKIISVFEKILPSNYSSLLLGIVFGVKSEFSNEFLDNLKLLGLMHVIAASGMNVTLVAGFLSGLFVVFLKRQLALILTIGGIIIYAFIAGLEPSIVRASIMGIIVFSSQILGRQRLAAYSLFLTAYIMIIFSPFVIWDIGFQLSVVSTAGLIFLRPVFYQLGFIRKILRVLIVGEDISTTVAAQIATLPIMLANFGVYSVLSLPVNALVLWTIPFIMIIGGIGFLFTVVFEPLGKLVMYLGIPFLFYFETVVNIFSNFPIVFESISPPVTFIIGYYLILVSIILWSLIRKNE